MGLGIVHRGWSRLAKLIEIEIADRLSRIRRLFRLPQRFLKLLLEQIGGVLLRLNRLLKNRVAPAVLLAHGFGGGLHVVESFRFYGSSVRDDCACFVVNFEHGIAAGTSHFESGGLLRHWSESYRKSPPVGQGWQFAVMPKFEL